MYGQLTLGCTQPGGRPMTMCSNDIETLHNGGKTVSWSMPLKKNGQVCKPFNKMQTDIISAHNCRCRRTENYSIAEGVH